MKLHNLIQSIIFTCCVTTMAFGQTPSVPFYANGSYNEKIQSPDDFLGFAIGSRPARAYEIERYFRYLTAQSPRVALTELGKSYEGRPLLILMISKKDNIANLESIRIDIKNFSDPRKTDKTAATELIDRLPAVAWMMYNVHGNELSGSDAAIQLAYQLAAGTDEATLKIINNLIIGIDPSQNPDGRERTLAQVTQWTGEHATFDLQSIELRGTWPGGRANHYLIDLNRDWFIGSQKETQCKVHELSRWNPQLVVDAHEMGSFSTYFFNPPREPISYHVASQIKKWWKIFSIDHANAFDQYGWSYYTTDSFDEWYPGYGSSWSFGCSAVGILYEQARTLGLSIKLPQGKVLTYRETVHHQFISSIANLGTAAEKRKTLLSDFYDMRVQAVSKNQHTPTAFVLLEGHNPTRTASLAANLVNQGIEVQRLTAKASFKNVKTYWNDAAKTITAPAGSYLINMKQPLSTLAISILEFDVRLNNRLLKQERKSLEEGKGTRMYEVGAWSMPIAYGVDALATYKLPPIKTKPFKKIQPASGSIKKGRASYGFILEYMDDTHVDALLMALNQELEIRSATKPFTLDKLNYKRGTLLFRRHENNADLDIKIKAIATATGVIFTPISTALTEKGANLGNASFRLLERPKLAIVTGQGISSTQFGAIWHFLDEQLGMRTTLLDIGNLGRSDLRKYNTLIIPPSRVLKRSLGKQGAAKLRDWINDGGTLIGIADAAAALTDSTLKISKVRLRRHVLKHLSSYEAEIAWEAKAGKLTPDSLTVWSNLVYTQPKAKKKTKPDFNSLSAQDKLSRIYMPRGAFMRINMHPEHWLGFGMDKKMPALCYSDKVFLSKRPIQTAARFADEQHLRISGLVWPEARARWAQSAYATREALGNGQIILFSNDPVFRAYTYATARMLVNAILLGPGLGTNVPVAW
ncbi:hypothetical protein KAR48_08085 [bacterium]|nr:hypothetical protein [bacterium]